MNPINSTNSMNLHPVKSEGHLTGASNSTNPSNLTGTNKVWFFFTILYIIIDYARPHDTLAIGFMRPLMLILLVLAFFLIFGGEYYRAKSKQTTLIWLFIFLLACYVPFARNNYYAFQTTKSMVLYMPFILSAIICVNSIDRLKRVIFIYICLMIYLAIYAFSHAGYGPANYFKDENDLCLYLNMWLPFCYFMFLGEKTLIKRIICISGILIGVLSVVVSFSRGGFVGLLAMTATVLLISRKNILSLVFILLMGLIMLWFGSDAYWSEMGTVTDTDDRTATSRMESWKSAWSMFLDNPLGVGGSNFPVRFDEYQSEYFKRGMWGRAAHSLWFTLIPELGIFGIIIYLSLLYYNLKDIFLLRKLKFDKDDEDSRYLHYLSLAFLASLAGYFASATFLSVLYYPHYWYLTGLIVVTSNVAKNLSSRTTYAEDYP